ncbi:LamG domain-containing protein [Streptomyces sp. SM11]|uniref:LamG domain-containing protein n=1 Tax=Streptomyces sp. SM11 TaxID=565557 RepID=UPI000CD4D472|nr:LamG domain-containing protein [Streptomyces sp. SM11]
MTAAGVVGRVWRPAVVVSALTALLATSTAALPGTAENAAAAGFDAAVAKAQESGEAPTEALARAAAAKADQPVEVTRLREERREVFANPDGSFTAQEYTQPVRTRRGDRWVAVDDTLAPREGGGLSPRAAVVELEFSGGGDGPFARMRKAGREYALTWPAGKLPKPQVEGNTARYAEVLPDVDLAVRAEVEGFSHYLIVKSAEGAAGAELQEIEFGLSTKGLVVERTAQGVLRAADTAAGGTVFESSQPAMWDSSGTDGAEPATGSRTGASAPGPQAVSAAGEVPLDASDGGRVTPVGLSVTNEKITLRPDMELLRADDAAYPVVIDPTPKTTSRTAWSSVMSGMPTHKEWKYSGHAGVGKCPSNYNPTQCANIGVRRLLFTFPMAFYQGKQILGTQFSARVGSVYWADASAEPIDLYRIGGKNYKVTSSSNWSNTKDDWSDYLATVDRKISPTSCSSQANLHFSNGELLDEAKAAASGNWSSMSLGLKAKNESTYAGWKRICGNSYLKITYNSPPKQVDYRLMSSNPGGKCTWGSGRPYTDVLPQLRAEARDPDHNSSGTDRVKMQFKVDWTDKNGVARSYTADTGYKSPNPGTSFVHAVKQRPAGEPQIPQSTVIYWSSRAYDGDAWGPWSYDGSPQRCEFMWDSTRPKAPAVGSTQYPADEAWHHGVGTAGDFTFTASDKDVQEFRYAFDGQPLKTLPAGSGGSATVTWTPQAAGRHWVTVEAYDNANNASVPAQYEFLVTDGKQAAGQWNLADEVGSELAHDETGRHPGRPGTGVLFGVPGPGGAADSAARFDGSANAYLDAWGTVMDTGESFTVSAWVRPTALDRDMAVVSQDSTGEPGFVLGYDATERAWAFSAPDMDVDAMVRWQATASGVPVVKDKWTQLTGVFDAHAASGPELRIYVNGNQAGKAARHTVWSSLRSFQIGQVLAKSGYRDHFEGDLAEVRAFDRVLPAAQVAGLLDIKPQRKGYWPLDVVTDGASANVQSGGQPLTLQGGAAVYQPQDPFFDEAALVGDGHLVLDGAGDWAATTDPAVSAADSYTVAVRAQLTALDSTESQTVLSLPGQNADRVAVRYQAATGQWELAVTAADSATAEVTTVANDQLLPSNEGSGQHLAVAFDSFTHEVRLYVDGQLTATAVGSDHSTWPSSGGLQVGRSAQGGGSEYFAGALDEVRVYAGVVDPTGVSRMNQLTGDTDL